MDIILLPGNMLLSLFGAASSFLILIFAVSIVAYAVKIITPLYKAEEGEIGKTVLVPKGKFYKLAGLIIFFIYLLAVSGTHGPRVVIEADNTSSNYLNSLESGRVDVEPAELVEHRSRQDLRDQREAEEAEQDKEWKDN